MNNPYVKYAIVVFVVLAAAEFVPEVVNVLLVLILIGMLLISAPSFATLAAFIGSAGK